MRIGGEKEDLTPSFEHGLAVRPIYHFKPERIRAHIGLCYLAFALTRHAQQRIKLAQQAMSVERMRAALHGVQASILGRLGVRSPVSPRSRILSHPHAITPSRLLCLTPEGSGQAFRLLTMRLMGEATQA
jgi:hypothetical protein